MSNRGEKLKKKKIGKYILGQKLGEGTFSYVRVAEDTETGVKYAIKVMQIENIQREGMEEQLKREIAISKKMKHRNVVEMKEVFKTKHNINIVMELVRGGELFDKIVQARRFSEPVARRYFQQLLLGLEYCHSKGVAHRDLKPENLLVDEHDIIKIMDFGLSNFVQENSLMQTTCGTPNYVAPEVLEGRGYDGFSADIWSCGVILYVMLAGRLPFEDKNMNVLFQKIKAAQFQIPAYFSQSTRSLIHLMLVVDPKKRPSVSELLRDPWVQEGIEEFLEAEDSSSSTSSPQNFAEITQDELDNAYEETEEERLIETVEKTGTGNSNLTPLELLSILTANTLVGLVSSAPPINTKTKFFINLPAEHAIHSMIEFLQKSRVNTEFLEDINVIKCAKPSQVGVITFAVHVRGIDAEGLDLSLVEVKQGRGDRLAFYDIFRSLKSTFSEQSGEGSSQ